MKVYLAGEREKTPDVNIWSFVQRRLFSFYYHGFKTGNVPTPAMLGAKHEDTLELFLDSGAFTAFTKKEDIPVAQYAQFVRDHGHLFSVCSSLDVIGHGEAAAAASYKVFQELRALDAPVIPVWHVREPDEWLARYVDEGHEYMAIGGMVPEATAWLLPRLDQLWGTILTHPDGTPKIKVHGFGLTTFSLMFRYPWFSVDSTSWLMTGVYGGCVIPTTDHHSGIRRVFFSPESPTMRKMDGWHYHSLTLVPNDPRKDAVDRVLARYNVTAEQCASSYKFRDLVNGAVYQDLERFGASAFFNPQPLLFNYDPEE